MLKIADDLTLPDAAVTEVLAWIGRRGSGKTYGATKACEEMHRIGAQFVALDAVGVWYGLRLSSDGKDAGINVPIFGGLHGDIPITPASGALVADTIVDHTLSAIVDTSQFEADSDKNRFVYDFASRFFYRKKSAPSAVHVFIEESQEYIPQNLQKGEEKMLHAMQRMIRLGRNYGIGASLITQRPQDVSKKALNQAEIVFAFQLVGPQELKAVAEWCQAKGYGDDLKALLPRLNTGHAHIWSPSLLDVNREIHIASKVTFAAGTTPKIGAKPVRTKPLEPLEIEALKTRMAETIEKAKADDPAELRKQIQQLKRQIAEVEKRSAAPTVDIQAEVHRAITGALDKQAQHFRKHLSALPSIVGESIQKHLSAVPEFVSTPIKIAPLVNGAAQSRPPSNPRPQPPRGGPPTNGDLSGPEYRIVDAIAWLEALGQEAPNRTAVAFLAGYTYGSGGFNNPCGRLRSKGLIEYVAGDRIRLTEGGNAAANKPDEVLTADELQRRVLARLPGPEQKILNVLLGVYPKPLTKDDCATSAGYTPGSGGFNNPCGRLRSLGLVDYPQPGMIAAQPVLFLES